MAGAALIRSVERKPAPAHELRSYPLNIPAIAGLQSLPLDPRVTILVGENGSGKSTLVEGIAVAAGLNAEGGSANFNFSSHSQIPELARHLRLIRGARRPTDGFFLRAESFFNVASEAERLAVPGLSGLHRRSHGEAFLDLVTNRFRAGGLYVLDEPEAALSPQGCINLMLRIHQLVEASAQFLIATHSPILMAFPGAAIHVLTDSGPTPSRFEDLAHVRLTRDFLAHPESYVRHLLAGA